MHHLYPTVKGDPLCPLGFHPQVRWPTRCKRCFRDYKEHGNSRKRDDDDSGPRTGGAGNLRRDDVTISSPSLSTWNSSLSSRNRDNYYSSDNVDNTRNWASSTSLSTAKDDYIESTKRVSGNITDESAAPSTTAGHVSSWTSTPDLSHLNNNTMNVVNYNLPLPKKRHTTTLIPDEPKIDTGQQKTTVIRPDLIIKKTDTLAERVKKLQAQKNVTNKTKPPSTDKEKDKEKKKEDVLLDTTSNDVQFLMQVKSKTPLFNSSSHVNSNSSSNMMDSADTISNADTDLTDTTLVGSYSHADVNELNDQIDTLKKELDQMRGKCERIEREKNDLLLRKITTSAANTTTGSAASRHFKSTASSDVLKLQQKVNELQTTVEDLQDDKKCLTLKVKELESELVELTSNKQLVQELQTKLTAAEQLCEELMDENEDMKKEMRDLEEEIEEMQDNFREDQADEYTSLKKELEQTSKNCRILSFKLRKAERKIDELEAIKNELEVKVQQQQVTSTPSSGAPGERIKQLESELKTSSEHALKLQEQLQETTDKLVKLENMQTTTTTTTTNIIKKKAPMIGNIGKSASYGSAEPSATTIKISRETLTRGGSQDDPAQLLRDLQDSVEREADLREQLKYAEEEAQNLRRKTSRIEDDNESLVLQLKKMATKARSRKLSPTSHLSPESSIDKDEGISDIEDPAELKLLLELNEQEAGVLRRKVEELEVENDMLNKKVKELHEKKYNTKSNLTTTTTTTTVTDSSADKKQIKLLEQELSGLKLKLKSSTTPLDKTTVNLKRQLEVIEQETQILHGKIKTLEQENEKLSSENKRLQLTSATKKQPTSDTSSALSTTIKNNKLKTENDQLKEQLKKLEADKNKLNDLKTMSMQEMKANRTAKIPTDLTTKLQMKRMVNDLENEVGELYVKWKQSEDAKHELELQVKNNLNTTDVDDSKLKTELNQLKAINEQLSKDVESNQVEGGKLKEQVKKLSEEVSKCEKKQEDVNKISEELKTLKKELQAKDKDVEQLRKSESDHQLQLTKTIDEKAKQIATLEKKISDLNEKLMNSEKELSAKTSELSKLDKERKLGTAVELTKAKEQIELLTKSKKTVESELTKLNKNVVAFETKNKDLESEIKALTAEQAKLKQNYERDVKVKESEIKRLETKVKTGLASVDSKRDATKMKEYEEEIKKLKAEVNNEKQEYDDLTRKYELLEEEHVVTKAEYVTEKENLHRQLQETETSLNELNEMNKKLNNKLVLIENQNDKELIEVLNDQIKNIKRENEGLKHKLDDYNKVDKIKLNINTDNTIMNLEKEIRQLTTKQNNQEKLHKVEMNESKMRYDKQLTIVNQELQQLQIQVKHFKKERDNYKDMLNEYKTNKRQQQQSPTTNSSINDNDKMIQLEQHVHYLEDQLSEANLETSKLKTELLSERSQWEIKLSELKTRCNELEEDRILASGRSKIPGQRTRMELAWQKEREEQQRLLQETSTLARDLRQTLFEVERERDKERLEFKRKQEQFKKFVDDENDENKKKLIEIQCDLLELRDAHAKLRTTNEKLRREKDRYERDFTDLRILLQTKKRNDLEEDKKLTSLLEYVDDLIKMLSDGGKAPGDDNSLLLAMTPTAPRRFKSKSRESSPAPDQQANSGRRSQSKEPSPTRSAGQPQAGLQSTTPLRQSNQIQSTIQRLIDATNELRKYQRLAELDRERERLNKRNIRRAASIETDNGQAGGNNLNRRSISLSGGGNNTINADNQLSVWKTSIDDDNSLSSLQSLEGAGASGNYSTSLDSRLSGGSTQSDIINAGTAKKKKSFIGKLKKLTKSHSIDDSTNMNATHIEYHQSMKSSSQSAAPYHQGSDSDVSLSEYEKRSSKKDLKGRITGIFKRAGSSSRSNSLERNVKKDSMQSTDSSSAQRPLVRNGSSSVLAANSKQQAGETGGDTKSKGKDKDVKSVFRSK